MGHRANFVVIREGQAEAYYGNWGAMGCVYQFALGPQAAAKAAATCEPTGELLDWAFAEGGYLLDFDEKTAIVFGPSSEEFLGDDLEELEDLAPDELTPANPLDAALREGPAAYLEAIKTAWSGWLLHWDDRGVDAFAVHLERRGISSIATQPPKHPARTAAASLQA